MYPAVVLKLIIVLAAAVTGGHVPAGAQNRIGGINSSVEVFTGVTSSASPGSVWGIYDLGPEVAVDALLAAKGVARAGVSLAEVHRLGAPVFDVAQLSVNAAARNRVFLGHFGGEGLLLGGQRVPVPSAGLQALEGLATRYGGRTLQGMPGNIDALAPALRSADEIIFNIGPGGIQPGSLTAQELQLLINENLLGRVKFVTGLTY